MDGFPFTRGMVQGKPAEVGQNEAGGRGGVSPASPFLLSPLFLKSAYCNAFQIAYATLHDHWEELRNECHVRADSSMSLDQLCFFSLFLTRLNETCLGLRNTIVHWSVTVR